MNQHNSGIHKSVSVEDLLESPSATAIAEFLTLMEESEVPRVFLIWSLISASAALIGRNSGLPNGPNITVRPNQFIILLGPPALKKSSAISAIRRLLEFTSVNVGPGDTGGQRHGLMSALTGLARSGRVRQHQLTPVIHMDQRVRRPNDMFLPVPELGRLLGSANREMADFLVDLWDGAAIDYQTKAGETLIREPLVNMLAGTTPSSMATMLPDNATSHGILSRIIFVYADEVHKKVPIIPDPDEAWYELEEQLLNRLRWIDKNRLPFMWTNAGREAYVSLYEYNPQVKDPRMESYKGRRQDHLLKVAMTLCALRADIAIHENDVLLAHALLEDIEPNMHKSLEFFGKNKIYQGRMLMLEFIKASATGTATQVELVTAASSALSNREAQEAFENLVKAKDIIAYGNTGTYMMNDNAMANVKLKRR